jgi:hypothetical protein
MSSRATGSSHQTGSGAIIAASTTSFTVPPSSFLIAFRSARSARTQVKRRCGPMRLL